MKSLQQKYVFWLMALYCQYIVSEGKYRTKVTSAIVSPTSLFLSINVLNEPYV